MYQPSTTPTLDAIVACFRGATEAVSISTESLAVAYAAGDWSAMIRILKAVGVHELAIGNVEAAVDHLERGIALARSSGYDHRTVRIVPDAVEALIAAERWQEAAPLVEELERCGAKSDRPWPVPPAHGAAASHKPHPAAWPRPRRLSRPRCGSATATTTVRTGSQSALCWSDRARAELARIAGPASNPLALTPTEAQVAELVARGRTNHEVAADLIISVKTVEANLTRIYRKLGVSSRRELARRAHGSPPSGRSEPSTERAALDVPIASP